MTTSAADTLGKIDEMAAIDARMRAIHRLFAAADRPAIVPATGAGLDLYVPADLADLEAVRAAVELNELRERWIACYEPKALGTGPPRAPRAPLPEADRAAFARNDRLAAIAIAVAAASIVAGLVAIRLAGMVTR
jgi:hypothetical protein